MKFIKGIILFVFTTISSTTYAQDNFISNPIIPGYYADTAREACVNELLQAPSVVGSGVRPLLFDHFWSICRLWCRNSLSSPTWRVYPIGAIA